MAVDVAQRQFPCSIVRRVDLGGDSMGVRLKNSVLPRQALGLTMVSTSSGEIPNPIWTLKLPHGQRRSRLTTSMPVLIIGRRWSATHPNHLEMSA
jgi:hypothetical protein